jgi:hypothetical protein
MALFDWAAAENKIAQVLAAAANIGAGKILWEGQGAPRPALPYVSLFRDAEECLSFTPEVVSGVNPSGAAGTPTQIAGAMRLSDGPGGASLVVSGYSGSLTSLVVTALAWDAVHFMLHPIVNGVEGNYYQVADGEALHLSGTDSAGRAYALDVTPSGLLSLGDGVSTYLHHADPVVGTELLIDYTTPAEFMLRVQVFTAEVRGNSAAPALLSKIHSYLETETARDALASAGLVVIDRGSIQNLTALVETRFEGRASLDIRMRFADGGQETATYIGSVELTPTVDEVTGTTFAVKLE